MSKFDYPSRYYADDKDVSDLLSEPKFNKKSLQRIARLRGIFVSSELSKEVLLEYISQLPFSWQELIKLLKSIETEEKEEHTAPIKIQSEATTEQFQTAVKEVQQLRGQSNSEVYTVNPTADGALIFVKYRELDHRSTRMLQWTDHTLEIQVRKTDVGFEVRYAATDRGNEIVEKIVDKLNINNKPPRIQNISLGTSVDSKKRTEFFRLIVYGMDGIRAENVKDVRLNKISTDIAGNIKIETEELSLEDDSEDEEKEEDNNSEIPATLHRTVLSGNSIFQLPEFQAFCEKGFFASRIIWTAVEKDAKARKFEMEMEFKNANAGSGFSYRIRGLWGRDDDGVLELKKSAIGLVDRRLLSEKIESAAFAALAEISVKKEEDKKL